MTLRYGGNRWHCLHSLYARSTLYACFRYNTPHARRSRMSTFLLSIIHPSMHAFPKPTQCRYLERRFAMHDLLSTITRSDRAILLFLFNRGTQTRSFRTPCAQRTPPIPPKSTPPTAQHRSPQQMQSNRLSPRRTQSTSLAAVPSPPTSAVAAFSSPG